MSQLAEPDTSGHDILDIDAFRLDVRAWLAEHCPQSMRTPATETEFVWGGRQGRFPSIDAKLWLDRMAERGWTCPTWPVKYGGADFSAQQNQILQQELRAINARSPIMDLSINLIGPALLEYGSEEQRLAHLPPVARGEIRWCQGYSEPGAGSDLASLRTSAVRRGDEYVINGSKIWTSHADKSDWIFCVARTDASAPKQNGLSIFLIDMESAGISVQPIRLIDGTSSFCQVFFDDVRVPMQNRVAEENVGWPISKRLLTAERNMVSSVGGSSALGGRGRRLHELARQYVGEAGGKIADPVIRDRIAGHEMNDRAFQLTLARITEGIRAGLPHPDMSNVFKCFGTEQNQRKYELMVEIMGLSGLGWDDADTSLSKEMRITRQWLRSKANTIEGGTTEIQLNIIAKRILALPD